MVTAGGGWCYFEEHIASDSLYRIHRHRFQLEVYLRMVIRRSTAVGAGILQHVAWMEFTGEAVMAEWR